MTQEITYDERFQGHLDLVDLEKIGQSRLSMIGLGSIGSWALLNLIKIGISKIKAYDFDEVERHNFSNQVFGPVHIGMMKTEAMQSIISAFNADEDKIQNIQFLNKRLETLTPWPKENIIVCAVDNMKARKLIWETAKVSLKCELFIDARVAGTGVQLFALNPKDPTDIEWFEDPTWEWLFSDDQAEPLPCTAKGTIHSAQMCALHIANAVAVWSNGKLKDYPRYAEYELNWQYRPKYNFREGAACQPVMNAESS